jgi:hypothetical protein
MSEKPFNANHEDNHKEAFPRPASRPVGPAAKKSGDWLPVAVMAVALMCAMGVIVGLILWLWPPDGPPNNGTPTPPITVAVPEIREVAKLESIEYYAVAEISQVQVPDNWIKELGVKEEIFILMYGTVVGGFDLTQLPDDAIWQDGWRVMLKLPAPEILRVEIDSDRSHVVYRKGWCPEVVCGDDLTRFIEEIEPQAVEQLKKQTIEYGLLERAAKSGRDYFYHFLKSLGFTEVRVVVDGYIYE